MPRAIVLLVVGLVAAACSPGGDAARMDGVWEAESFRLDGATQDVEPEVNVVHIPWVAVEGNTIQGEAGCNAFGGSFSVTDDGALILGDVFMEAAYCLPSDASQEEDAVMQADFALQALMGDEISVSVSDSQMVWSRGDDSITFKSVSSPPTTEPVAPPRFHEIGRLDCGSSYVEETRVPDTGQDPMEIARAVDPNVVAVKPGQPLWHSGLDAEGRVIVELALGDMDGADYQVWTCEG